MTWTEGSLPCPGCTRMVHEADLCHHRRPTCRLCCMRYCGGAE